MYRSVLSFALLCFSALSVPMVHADRQYVELPRNTWLAPSETVEVMELFSYGCRYCHDLEPILIPWVKQLPANVHFTRVPAMVGGIWNVYGRLYLTLDTLKVAPAVHMAVFEAIHNRKVLDTPEALAQFLVGEGIDKERFLSTYHSFAVQAKVKEAIRKTAAFKVTGVPALVINGKYRFDQTAGGAQGMLKLAEELITKEQERSF